MVVMSSIIGKLDGADATVVNAVATGEVQLAISDDQLSELVRVVGYGDIEVQISRPIRAFEVALDLGSMGFMYHPRRFDWPSLTDQKDGWMFDLAYVSGADYIVTYDNAVHEAADQLGFESIYPGDLLQILRGEYES